MILNGLLALLTRIDVFNSESVTTLLWSAPVDVAHLGCNRFEVKIAALDKGSRAFDSQILDAIISNKSKPFMPICPASRSLT